MFKVGDKVQLKERNKYGSCWSGELTVLDVTFTLISASNKNNVRGGFSESELEHVSSDNCYGVWDYKSERLLISRKTFNECETYVRKVLQTDDYQYLAILKREKIYKRESYIEEIDIDQLNRELT